MISKIFLCPLLSPQWKGNFLIKKIDGEKKKVSFLQYIIFTLKKKKITPLLDQNPGQQCEKY